jgi:predicted DCC family thiol-disulfide oxidoreductase YuxK
MATEQWDVEVFFDGACPLCMREIDMLRRLDRRARIRFTDIADEAFDAAAIGTDYPSLMERIQGRLPDGTWIEGVEVFRRLYSAVGFSKLVAVTRVPGISHAMNAAYTLVAKNRLKLTGRCVDGVCEVPHRTRPQ